ncbi:hypothetical protein KC337_g9 [Hortaea werneckii]|nr:hypothetical protein KC337_g9 [Hortaea werneckii]
MQGHDIGYLRKVHPSHRRVSTFQEEERSSESHRIHGPVLSWSEMVYTRIFFTKRSNSYGTRFFWTWNSTSARTVALQKIDLDDPKRLCHKVDGRYRLPKTSTRRWEIGQQSAD